ncbi:hypothetical protein TNCT_650291 [Trichonephila clavata]|uniref:Uncharacterized protein n=1 Tax=Trichonephila clavata TaxID=2740835 RepID=A0A8X6L883_TRICU|nr:hypothetical protein TNCT_650291 [Trichonephila clavata]
MLHAMDRNPCTSVEALAAANERSRTTFIVYWSAKPYFRFMYSYYSQMIIHDVSCLLSGLITKLRQPCNLQVSCCSVIKRPFPLKGCSIRKTHTCGP